MEKICTTLDQSKKLIELGIDVNTADIYLYEGTDGNYYPEFPIERDYDDVPAWSLTALLGLMPEIHSERPKLDTGRIQTDKYYVEYPYHERTKKDWHSTELYDEPLDAAFEMVVWLKENNML